METMASSCFARKGEFVARNVAGETILVPVRACTGDLNSIYVMSEVANFIWNQVDGETTVQQIVDGVCGEFEVPPEVAQRDAQELLAALQQAGLVEPRTEATV